MLSVAQRYFGLPPDIVGAALGGLGVEEVGGLEALIPDNIAVRSSRQARINWEAGSHGIDWHGRVSPAMWPHAWVTAYSAASASGGWQREPIERRSRHLLSLRNCVIFIVFYGHFYDGGRIDFDFNFDKSHS